MLQKLDHHHRLTLNKLFGHPLSRNIQWHDVECLLERLGSVGVSHRGNVTFQFEGTVTSLGKARGHDLTETQVIQVRHLLESLGLHRNAA